MEDLCRGGLVGLFLYGNFLLFSGYIKTIFWALCYSVLCGEIRKKHFKIFQPISFVFLSVFSIFTAIFLPSVLILLLGKEISEYVSIVTKLLPEKPFIYEPAKNAFLKLMVHMCEFLEIRKDEKLTDSFIIYKVYMKLQEMKMEIFSGSKKTVDFIFNIVFFIGFVGWFNTLQNMNTTSAQAKEPAQTLTSQTSIYTSNSSSILCYIFKPVPRHLEIVKLFEEIIYTLAIGSLFNFFISFFISFYFNSSLIFMNGILSAFLSVFPVLPIFLYSAPTVFELFLENKPFASFFFLILAMVQQIFYIRLFSLSYFKGPSRKFSNGFLKSSSVALGLKVFGLPGSILGPFLVYSLIILWPAEKPNKLEPIPAKNLKQTVPKKMTKAMEILRKSK